MVSVYDLKKDRNHAFLWFTLALSKYLGDAVAPYFFCKKPKCVYVTVEGLPSKATVLYSNIPKMDLVANSEFTAKCLRTVGLNVVEVVHHALDTENCRVIKESSLKLRQKWEAEYGTRTKIIYVGRNDPRKGLTNLATALDMIPEEVMNKFVLLLFSDGLLDPILAHNNVVQLGGFGTLQHDQVLEMIGASDYLIFPTVSEGFGLPVLEANGMGVPAIHAWIPPLCEFSSKEHNFVFSHTHEDLVNNSNRQFWVFHQYRSETLAEMITQAVRVHQDSRKEYDEYCSKALAHSKAWDYKKIYPPILSRLGIA